MRAALGAIFLCFLFSSAAGAADKQDAANAERAYRDMIKRFWTGPPDSGHLAMITQTDNVEGQARELPPAKGWLWQYAEGWNPIYAYWKITGSADAKTRLAAEWRWITENWSFADMSLCGRVGRQSASSQDDSSWASMGLLQLYDATGDRKAMAFAKSVIECATKRWSDNVTGGGLWYEDDHSARTGKQVSNGNFGLSIITLYDDTCRLGNCDVNFLNQAKSITAWGANRLMREDGLYWMGVGADGQPIDGDRPNKISQGVSVVSLFGNMGFAALDAVLFRITKEPTYRDHMIKTVDAILKRETVDGVFLDDRDARGNGYVAWNFVADVLPQLPDPEPAKAAVLATARAVATKDRGPDGAYGGDWNGPVEGVWEGLKLHRDRLEISANAAIWPVVGQAIAK
jgi:hypothetical protein